MLRFRMNDFSNKKIVFIEDQAIIREFYEALLSSEGFTYLEFFNNAESFIKKYPTILDLQGIEIIFIDHYLDGHIEGLELASHLKAGGICIPLVMTSSAEQSIPEFRLVTPYILLKPFKGEELCKFVFQLLNIETTIESRREVVQKYVKEIPDFLTEFYDSEGNVIT